MSLKFLIKVDFEETIAYVIDQYGFLTQIKSKKVSNIK